MAEKSAQAIQKIKEGLDSGQLVSQMNLTDEEKFLVKDLNLLTAKPIIYVYNCDEAKVAELSSPSRYREPFSSPVILSEAKDLDSGDSSGRTPQNDKNGEQSFQDAVYVSAKLEAELSALSEGEQKAYLKELKINESGLDKVIKKAYEILGLSTFLTAGPKEVRAWTVKLGSKAPKAAGVIHTDFERGFIAAEVISADELMNLGSYRLARERGKIRLEGKEYIVNDGDVVEFRFSV
jgi:ribosome-binding ATPase YchF (GTP1/OBG family)